jgi:membrane-associated phospholipid phosphatase
MKAGFKEISKASTFIITSLIFILIGGIILLTQDKVEIHLAINSVHNSFLDVFFKYWTYIGDGIVAPIIVVLLGVYSFKKNRFSTFAVGFGSLIMAGILSQFLKRVFFEGALRPSGFIGAENLYLVPGVEAHTIHSFPSGHTTAGFAFMAFIACLFFTKHKVMQVILALVAVLIGYSRMYLSQHFLEDAVFGGVIGLVCFLASYTLMKNIPLGKSL